MTTLPDKSAMATTTTELERPYRTLRSHRKSRTGCTSCKARRVKCIYPSAGMWTTPDNQAMACLNVVPEPLFIPLRDRDLTDMKFFWFYTTTTFASFLGARSVQGRVEEILKIKVPRYAFDNPFLMDTLLGLSAFQLQDLGHDVKPARTLHYRVQAFQGYRRAIEAAEPETFPALVACSVLLVGLASQMFRESGTKELYILDWMVVWSGIGVMIDVVKPAVLWEYGLPELFFRPPLDLDGAILHVPVRLLSLVFSISEEDPERPHISTYYNALKYLGTLYAELRNGGFGPVLTPRILTWFTFLPRPFITLSNARKPLALLILAHYAMFTKLVQHIWWVRGIADREIPGIVRYLGPKWAPELAVVMATVGLEAPLDVARVILANPAWLPVGEGAGCALELGTCWPSAPLLRMVDQEGRPLRYDRETQRLCSIPVGPEEMTREMNVVRISLSATSLH
ncbi:hypothetical protein FOTG_18853 [Fusarium oxysporum f. sp. vasinfectum 25433]|uniref:Zn(2)-C6 fungal-type domain-containing protein n=1 Tax=Fusarium oxysporum f. sp. vasinfectum 25433 TaxID=1089449 RepID=X0LVY6_FUSOX|nr:hypothetical protein FOTG_18853 [Fusarium oxysporum f. sp. vasinfectum 25433]